MGVVVSALSRNDRKAMFGTALAVTMPAFVPFSIVFFMTVVMEVFQSPSDLEMALPFLMANPVYPFLISLPQWLPNWLPVPAWSFWVSLGFVHVLSWVALLVTTS